MEKTIIPDSKLGFRYLAKGKQDFFSKGFTFTWNPELLQGKAKEKKFEDNVDYDSIIKKRKREESEGTHYATQMQRNDGKVNINFVSTATFIIGNITLKDGRKKKYFICDSKREYSPFYVNPERKVLMALPFSKCVNLIESKDLKSYSKNPILYSLLSGVSRKLMIEDEKGDAVGIDFVGHAPFPVFEQTSYKSKVFANLVKNPWWLKTMNVNFQTQDGAPLGNFDCVLDTRYNSLIATCTYEIDINLNYDRLVSSQKLTIDNIVYDKYLDEQGRKSNLTLLPFGDIFDGIVYKPDFESETGLTRTGRPAFYSEMFNTHFDENKIAVTNGYRCHPNAFTKKD